MAFLSWGHPIHQPVVIPANYYCMLNGEPYEATWDTEQNNWTIRRLTGDDLTSPSYLQFHREQEEAAERERQRAIRQQQINEKAKTLLLSCLTVKQREQYDKDECFKVVGSRRGRYIIDCRRMNFNVFRTFNRKPVLQLCAYPPGTGSMYDIYLAQKLLLESDEPAFLAVAHTSRP